MLFHNVSNWALGVLRGIFVVNEDFSAHRNGYNPSEVLIAFIVEFASVTTPESQSSDSLFMILEVFHPGSVPDIDCEDAASTVSNEKLSLAVVQNDIGQLMTA